MYSLSSLLVGEEDGFQLHMNWDKTVVNVVMLRKIFGTRTLPWWLVISGKDKQENEETPDAASDVTPLHP